MKKLIMVLTLAIGFVAVATSAGAFPPPTCSPNCPWVR